MTLQEAKDQAAKEMGFPNWADYMTDHQGFEKVCELYARAKWDEASDYYIEHFDGNLPSKPEFKP